MGLIETITFKELGPVEAKIDSGNGAYNVLHGVNVKVLPDGRVSFNTVNDQILDLPIEEFIDINIGDGVIKKRPVVSFDIAVGDDYYPNTKFSIGDRTENEYKILVGKEFIEQLGGLIDVTKQNNLD
jgi:hypothetical protein